MEYTHWSGDEQQCLTFDECYELTNIDEDGRAFWNYVAMIL
jgi:hypothetical protein